MICFRRLLTRPCNCGTTSACTVGVTTLIEGVIYQVLTDARDLERTKALGRHDSKSLEHVQDLALSGNCFLEGRWRR